MQYGTGFASDSPTRRSEQEWLVAGKLENHMAHDRAVEDTLVTGTAELTLRSLDGVRPLYMLPSDPLAEEVLIPGFRAGRTVDCMVGFFSSTVLASLAPGLATYIADSENSFRLVISPLLRAEDKVAIEAGLNPNVAEISG